MITDHYCCFAYQTSNFILRQPTAKGWSSCWMPQRLGVPKAVPGEGSGGKPTTAPARESRALCLHYRRRGRRRYLEDPLDSLQNESSRGMKLHETRLYQSGCSWSSVTHAGVSLRKVKRAGEALQQTVVQKLPLSERDPTPMVACVVNPLGFLRSLTGLLHCLGIWNAFLRCDVVLRE